VARDVVLLDDSADHALGFPVAVHVGGVPGVEAAVVGAFEKFVYFGFVVNDPRLPVSVACWTGRNWWLVIGCSSEPRLGTYNGRG